MAREINPNKLSADDKLYLRDRPWLVQEMSLQGYEIPDDLADPVSTQDDTDSEGDESYDDLTVARLEEEISRRNAEYDEDSQIVPASGRKADLVAALEADDEEE